MSDRRCEHCDLLLTRRPRDSLKQWESRRFCSVRCNNRSRPKTAPALRFCNHVEAGDPSQCWIWGGATDGRGYGQIQTESGVPAKAHRVSWEMQNGPIPLGMEICHRCDTPACVNPHHLFLGTRKDNAMDCAVKGRLNPKSRLNLRPGAPGHLGAGPLNQEHENARS